MIKIRYSEDGDIECYDSETGEIVGHISTMGNLIEPTEEDEKRRREAYEKAMKKYGFEP